MPSYFKVAFIGDQGLGRDSRAVLEMIRGEGAYMVLHSGDFDYYDDPDRWDQQINETLGDDFPYFASIGNHDVPAWEGYQRKLQKRLARISGARCTGDLGVNSFCTYKGLFFVLSGVGTIDSGRVSFIREALASKEAKESLWRICSWHKNQRFMQVGGKGDSVGWEPYEECRKAGAIIATGHEHSYSRTHLMDSFETQSIASKSDVLHIDSGKSFAFVSGLAGLSIRGQDDQLAAKPWWAAVHTSAQGADYGALFCSFNHDGVENRGICYFRDLKGVIADEFEVVAGPKAETPPTAAPLPSPPASLGLDPIYEVYLDADGLPIVSSAGVPAAALFQGKDLIDEMLVFRTDLRRTMVRRGVRVAVMAHSQSLNDLPEYSDLGLHPDGISWDERTKGGGLGPTSRIPVAVIAEGNLLCYGDDAFPYEDIFVHEFAHAVLSMAVEQQTGGTDFRRRLEGAYSEALDAGRWLGTYASENPDEYWAEGVQSWFGLNDPPGAIHNDINTRAELESYDPVLAVLIQEALGDAEVSSSCHETVDIYFSIRGVVKGPDGRPLEGISLWAWQGKRSNSGGGSTGPGGEFDIKVPEGSFTLDFYVGGGCVGWFDGDKSIITRRAERARVTVDGASVSGIEIVLPGSPDSLRRFQC